jgi:hypothetical protein
MFPNQLLTTLFFVVLGSVLVLSAFGSTFISDNVVRYLIEGLILLGSIYGAIKGFEHVFGKEVLKTKSVSFLQKLSFIK